MSLPATVRRLIFKTLTTISVYPVSLSLSVLVDMPPLVYANAHTCDPHLNQVLRAIQAVSAPDPPPTLAGAPLRRIISISDSDSEHEAQVAQLSTRLGNIRVFVIPDDPADDSEYQEYQAEKAKKAARHSAREKVKEGKRKATSDVYSDPEMDAFMAGLPLNEKSGTSSVRFTVTDRF